VPIIQLTQIQNSQEKKQIHENKNIEQTKQKHDRKKQYKGSTSTKTLTSGKKHRSADVNISQISAEFVLKKQCVS
jgi:hypothetical protein